MNKIHLACALAAGLASSLAAQAGEAAGVPTAYVGGTFGRAKVNGDIPAGYVGSDDSDTGVKLYAGFRLSRDLSAEVSYFDFGQFSRRTASVEQKLSTKAWGFGLAYKPVIHDRFFAIGRIGLATLQANWKSGTAEGDDNTKIRPYFGIGAGFAITPKLDVQATWDFTRTEIPGESPRRVDLLGLGLSLGF